MERKWNQKNTDLIMVVAVLGLLALGVVPVSAASVVEVIYEEPIVPNPFGHSAIRVGDKVYDVSKEGEGSGKTHIRERYWADVLNDERGQQTAEVTMTDELRQQLREHIEDQVGDDYDFNFITNNCADWVEDQLRWIGFNIPDDTWNSPKITLWQAMEYTIPPGVTLYQYNNYYGRSETFTSNKPNLAEGNKVISIQMEPTWINIDNNMVSSIKVYPGYTVTLYEHINYDGKSETFTSNDPDLRDNTIGNDRASSLKIWLSKVYVDGDAGSPQHGTEGKPVSTVNEGVEIVASGGTIIIAVGSYPESMVISKSMTLKARRGTVVIG